MDEPPLTGLRVVEFAAIGPVPFAAMMLADLGADVIRIERPELGEFDIRTAGRSDPVLRGRRVLRVDLKNPGALADVRVLVGRADVVLEGFRPGTLEDLGLDPHTLVTEHPALIVGRMTGWGQQGPLARTAGHDLNFLAATGALHAIGPRSDPPPVPLNLVADYGGGAMFLLLGVLTCLVERERSGRGQIIDAAMVDGVRTLLEPILSLRSAGLWSDARESNLLDGAAPFYRTYACADGRYVAVGALEKRFYTILLETLGLSGQDLPDRDDPGNWPRLRSILAKRFAARSRDEWAVLFAGTDACVTPVRAFDELDAEGAIDAGERDADDRGAAQLAADRVCRPAGAPRFSRSGRADSADAREVDIAEALASWS